MRLPEDAHEDNRAVRLPGPAPIRPNKVRSGVAVVTESRVRRDWRWPFWSVLVLSIPSFTALLIMLFAFLGPKDLIPSEALQPYFYAPLTLVPAILIATVTRTSMRHYWRRNTWLALSLAAFAAVVALVLSGVVVGEMGPFKQ